MRHLIAFPSVLVCALAACSDPPSPTGPAATEPASLQRRPGRSTQVRGTAQLLVRRGAGRSSRESAVGPGGALSSPRRSPAASGASTRRPAPARLPSPPGCRPASPSWSSSAAGWSTVAFIGGTAYALVTGRRPGPRGRRHRRHLPSGRPEQLYRHRGHRRVVHCQSAGSPFFAPSGYQYAIERPSAAGSSSRRTPQPGAAGHARRRDNPVDRVRRPRPDRAGRLGQLDLLNQAGPIPPFRRTARW